MSGKSLMHDSGESYSGIVPTKQPNKSEASPAEVVEGRPLTKENTRQPNPYRTPSRESGRSGLERVREARPRGSTLSIQTSEVGTVCVRSASTGLCGGRSVMVVPTATLAWPCGPPKFMKTLPRRRR
jgi:hypothetical protein